MGVDMGISFRVTVLAMVTMSLVWVVAAACLASFLTGCGGSVRHLRSYRSAVDQWDPAEVETCPSAKPCGVMAAR